MSRKPWASARNQLLRRSKRRLFSFLQPSWTNLYLPHLLGTSGKLINKIWYNIFSKKFCQKFLQRLKLKKYINIQVLWWIFIQEDGATCLPSLDKISVSCSAEGMSVAVNTCVYSSSTDLVTLGWAPEGMVQIKLGLN